MLERLTRFHLGIYQPGQQSGSQNTRTVQLWDALLRSRKAVWGVAADDSHNLQSPSSNRGWILVNSTKGPPRAYLEGPGIANQPERREDLVPNIRAGNFYSVVRDPLGEGPPRESDDLPPRPAVSVLGGIVAVSTEQISDKSTFYGGPSIGPTRVLEIVRDKLSASYTLAGDEAHVGILVEQTRAGERYWVYTKSLFVRVGS